MDGPRRARAPGEVVSLVIGDPLIRRSIAKMFA
jgi:hypothetical protein